MTATPQGVMEPNVFWLLITSSSIPTDPSGRSTNEEELYQSGLVAHKYTSLSSQRPRDSIESISNWRARFPQLFRLYTTSSLSCDIIYMDVALSLMTSHPPEGAELVSRTEISIPNSGHDQETNIYLNNSTWRIATTLSKPAELCRDPAVDPAIENQTSIIPVLSMNAQETRIKVPFPAMAWAHAFTSLTDLSQRPPSLSGLNASSLLDEISMFQEVQCSPGPGRPFQRRAIILWTFRKSRDGESSCTTWRYLDPGSPSRHDCMSPDPGHSERINADMSENFNSSFMAETLENTVMDPFIQSHSHQQHTGLSTPPATAGLLSPFGAHQQSVYAMSGLGIEPQFNIPGDSLSFESAATVDSESTLVESDVVGNLENFIVNSNVGIELAGFDSGHQSWDLDGASDNNAVQSFESSNPNWAYSALHNPSNSVTPHLGGWEDIGTGSSKGDEWIVEEVSKGQEWTESGVEQRVKELEWVVELPAQDDEERVWEVTECEVDIVKPTSTRNEANAAELDEEDYEAVGNWVEERHDHHESVDELSNLNDLRPSEQGAYSPSPHKTPGTKEGVWEGLNVTDGDGFDYTQLTERLK
jgi:transcriptional enhancer factor